MIYHIAEKFKSIQGEGLYAGTPMAFIRFVGCSVGKTICHHCDTDFDKTYPWLGGGEFTDEELLTWVRPYHHICLTGGEPLNQDLRPFLSLACDGREFHIETSGTIIPEWKDDDLSYIHICVSPKPGFSEKMIQLADEVKVIVPGLGNGEGWPTLDDARRWSYSKTVFLQPRNAKYDINNLNLALCEKLVNENPTLRLSVQMHKILRVR